MGRDVIQGYLQGLQECIAGIPVAGIERVVGLIYEAYCQRRQVFILGNGGSAATASHFCCDLGKEAVVDGRPRLRVISLNDNTALLTAYANDMGYASVFVEQMKNLVQEGDLVICLSGSGNSANVLEAIDFANQTGAYTVGLLGFGGGKAKEKVTVHITVENTNYGQVEDVHMFLSHCISQCFREWVMNGKGEEIPFVPLSEQDGEVWKLVSV